MNDNSILFYGTKITPNDNGKYLISYSDIASKFNAVLCNCITKLFYAEVNGEYCEPVLVSGNDYDEEEDAYEEVYQYFIVDNYGVDVLKDLNEIVYYVEKIDAYIWGVTHYGTMWSGVYTEIPEEYVKRYKDLYKY